MRNKPGVMPEPNRLIKVFCCDWSDYATVGMFIPYKPIRGKPQKRGPRFCRKDEFGNWESDRKTWSDVEEWEYVEANHEP